jgi:hypothetical protein
MMHAQFYYYGRWQGQDRGLDKDSGRGGEVERAHDDEGGQRGSIGVP